jgi:hypothetical protein
MIRTCSGTGDYSCEMHKKAALSHPTNSDAAPYLAFKEVARLGFHARIDRAPPISWSFQARSLSSSGGRPRQTPTARVERPPFHRGGSVSTRTNQATLLLSSAKCIGRQSKLSAAQHAPVKRMRLPDKTPAINCSIVRHVVPVAMPNRVAAS